MEKQSRVLMWLVVLVPVLGAVLAIIPPQQKLKGGVDLAEQRVLEPEQRARVEPVGTEAGKQLVGRAEPVRADQLLPLVYEELRRLAAAKLAHEKPGRLFKPLRWCMRPISGWWTWRRLSSGIAEGISLPRPPRQCAGYSGRFDGSDITSSWAVPGRGWPLPAGGRSRPGLEPWGCSIAGDTPDGRSA